MHSISLYFLGTARPAHWEAKSLPAVIRKVERAMAGCSAEYQASISSHLRNLSHYARRGYSSASSEHGTIGVSWKTAAVEYFALRMDRICHEFPDFPGLDYSGAVALLEA